MPRKRIELIVIGVLITGIIGYAAASIVYSANRVDSAHGMLVTVVSHQNNLNTSFGDINSQVTALNSSSAFDPEQALILVDKSIANSELAMRTVNHDDAALGASERELRAFPWLTMLGRSSVDRESRRLGHARAALAAARTIASGELLDARFWRVLYAGLADFTTLSSQSSSGDVTGARSTLAKMKGEIDDATGLSTAPGLPTDLRSLMSDLQTFVVDYGKRLDAEATGDDTGASSADATLEADATKVGTYDIDKIGGEIDAFYRPLIDRFNAEMAAATANQPS
jgi:hypothetical protein